MTYQFFKDEKNLEDLKDLKGGIEDLLDYGQDFIMGSQLGDGNKTAEASFSEKIKEEMKKSINEDE